MDPPTNNFLHFQVKNKNTLFIHHAHRSVPIICLHFLRKAK